MNRLKEIRPLIILTCLITAIAIFSIHSYSFDENPPKKANSQDTLSVGQVSKSITDIEAEQQREQFMAASEGQYTASRGEYDRLTETRSAVQAAPAAEKPTAPAEAKPAAPAAKPKTAPVVKSAAAKPASQYESDVDVLARLIMAEAQAEPYEAKVAVGAVVINRLQSGQWANTVKGVIYQKSGGYYQFTPVQNGWIDKPADAECIRAAKEALSGADPTNGAQFYYDDKVTNEWILAKPVSIRIGHMTYAY
jgi:spore germination cell wall hydrolase CwlJ-like protein